MLYVNEYFYGSRVARVSFIVPNRLAGLQSATTRVAKEKANLVQLSIKTERNLHNFYDCFMYVAAMLLFYSEKWQSLRLYNAAHNIQLMCLNCKQEFSIKHFFILTFRNAMFVPLSSYWHFAAIITQFNISLQDILSPESTILMKCRYSSATDSILRSSTRKSKWRRFSFGVLRSG